MAKTAKSFVTNNHTGPIEVPNSEGGVVTIPAGETRPVVLADPEVPQVAAWRHVEFITVSDTEPKDGSEVSTPSTGTLAGPGAPPAKGGNLPASKAPETGKST